MRTLAALACILAATQHADAQRLAIAGDGRIALSYADDIWILTGALDTEKQTRWERVTQHLAADRDPAWAPDGKSLVFASNRAGSFDLYRIPVAGGAPTRLTQSPRHDREPQVTADDTILFVRGTRSTTRIYRRDGKGRCVRVTTGDAPEHSLALSPDGKQIVFVTADQHLYQVKLTGQPAPGRALVTDRSVDWPNWSPDGKQIVFCARGRRGGVYATDARGSYQNLVRREAARAVFTPDGQRLVLLELPPREPGYNGDPDRGPLRRYAPPDPARLPFAFVRAPRPLNDGHEPAEWIPPFDPARTFDRLVARLAKDHSDELRASFLSLAKRARPRAARAKDQEALDSIIGQLLRYRPSRRSEVSGRAVVSSAHPAATEAGLRILRDGGNAVDAAIAVSFALGVVEPDASGIGGYGEMLVYQPGMSSPTCIEFMTKVPGRIADVKREPGKRLSGPQRVNVPGVVAGMQLAFDRYKSGKVEWGKLLAPAVQLAKDGFVIDDAFATTLVRNRDRFKTSKGCRELFFRDGEVLRNGDRLVNPGLAWTLEAIAKDGAAAFYSGAVAEKLVADLRGHGSVLQSTDLKNYYAVERQPIRAEYRGHVVYSGAPPVTGGAALAGKLSLLDHCAKLAGYQADADAVHAMIEAWKLAPRTYGKIADPGIWNVDTRPFSDRKRAGKVWKDVFRTDKSLTPKDLDKLRKDKRIAAAGAVQGVLDRRQLTGTTAFVVADRDGTLVAVTQTLGTWGGNFHVTPGLGFLYNDKLRGPSSDPSRFGASVANARVGTVIAPTLVFKEDRPFAALGAAGNAWITAAVYQMVCGIVDHGLSPQAAIELPRFLVGGRRRNGSNPEQIVVQVEDDFAPGVLERLRELGHGIQRISLRGELRMGYAAIATIDGGTARAGADPRRSGAAGAIR